MKTLVTLCLAVCALVTVVGCSDNNTQPASTTSSATMSSDTKNMSGSSTTNGH